MNSTYVIISISKQMLSTGYIKTLTRDLRALEHRLAYTIYQVL